MPRWLCLILLFVLADSSAQTIKYSEEEGTFDEQQFVDVYDYIFLTKEPAKSLFKLDLVNTLPISTTIGKYSNTSIDLQAIFELTYEQKLSNVFSVNFSAAPFYNNTVVVDYTIQSVDSRFELGLSLEPRWYFDMRKRILASQSANNLSGNYLGLRVGGSWIPASLPGDNSTLTFDRVFAQLRLGQQRRIFKNSFFDINGGIGTIRKRVYLDETRRKYKHKWDLLLGLKVGLGWAIGGEVNKAPDAVYCDAFRCDVEEKSMFKIGLLHLIEGNSSSGFNGEINLEYEHKLGASTWSMNYGGRLDYFISARINSTKENRVRTGYGISIAPRWYYNLKERIAKGKTANNLSSNYFTLHTVLDSRPGIIYNDANDQLIRYRDLQLAIIPAWGFQRRFFKKGYIDYKIGFGPTTDSRDLPREIEDQPSFLNRDFFDRVYYLFLSELKIGLAF